MVDEPRRDSALPQFVRHDERRAFMHRFLRYASGTAGLSALSACTLSPTTRDPVARDPAARDSAARDSAARVPEGRLQAPSAYALTPFSKGREAIGPGRWEPWGRHPAKPPTHYEIVRDLDRPVLLARARSSVSGLKHRVNRPAADFLAIRWKWRIDAVLEGADVGVRHAEDAPARVLLAFDGDRSRLGIRDLLLSEQFQLLTGQALPYATLMYVWDGGRPEGEIVHNPHTGRIRKIVVQSGGTQAGRWLTYERDFHADFVRAYGEAPGTLVGVGVMTDSDNTRQSARCLYGDVQLVARPQV